jgi:hypothetical protein
MHANYENRARQIKDAPFCWQHKGALRMIRDVFEDGHGHSAFALSTYVALSELASDPQSETFTASINQIARRAGASYNTAAKILNRFQSIKLIAVQRNLVPGTKEHAPSTYTMLGTPCVTLRKREASRLPKRLNNRNKLNTASPRSDSSTRNVKSKPQRPASPGLEGKEKDSDWLRRTPLHVLKRRREKYQNERSQLLELEAAIRGCRFSRLDNLTRFFQTRRR